MASIRDPIRRLRGVLGWSEDRPLSEKGFDVVKEKLNELKVAFRSFTGKPEDGDETETELEGDDLPPPRRPRRRRFWRKPASGGRGPGQGTGPGRAVGRPGLGRELGVCPMTKEDMMGTGKVGPLLSELRQVLGLEESPAAPVSGSLEDWEKWAKEVLSKESGEVEEAKKKGKKKVPKGVLKKHCEQCSVECMQKNIRHFYHVRGDDIPRAVATSYSILRKACGIPKETPQLTPKEIVAQGKG